MTLTKTFSCGEYDVILSKTSIDEMQVDCINGIGKHTILLRYETEAERDVAFNGVTQDLADTLVNGVEKINIFKQFLS